ncbi:871_t:CDS:1, partial [Dentiscutata erythropus]
MRKREEPYVKLACTSCKKAHAKCSGHSICERCINRNLICEYEQSGRKRGPKSKKQ